MVSSSNEDPTCHCLCAYFFLFLSFSLDEGRLIRAFNIIQTRYESSLASSGSRAAELGQRELAHPTHARPVRLGPEAELRSRSPIRQRRLAVEVQARPAGGAGLRRSSCSPDAAALAQAELQLARPAARARGGAQRPVHHELQSGRQIPSLSPIALAKSAWEDRNQDPLAWYGVGRFFSSAHARQWRWQGAINWGRYF